jgi:hypothetical protein
MLLPQIANPPLPPQHYIDEARRYIQNGKDTLVLAGIEENGFYHKDPKYVSKAAGIAYVGVLKAIDGLYVHLTKQNPDDLKHVEAYNAVLRSIPKESKRLLRSFNTLYMYLHVGMYYREERRVSISETAFELADEFVDAIETLLTQ